MSKSSKSSKSVNKEDLPYRPNVGMMLINRDGLVFVAQRLDFQGDVWQMPQGGLDKGEDPKEAALRELEEEIGTRDAEIIGEIADWLPYDLPEELIGKLWKGKYRGQTQKWYAMRFLGDDSAINIDTDHPEFSRWKWAPVEELTALVVPFKRDIYERVVAELGPYCTAIEP
ncbi:MAG: RNA pyrophosphohydrolase [Rhodospirillaceae bacterium]